MWLSPISTISSSGRILRSKEKKHVLRKSVRLKCKRPSLPADGPFSASSRRGAGVVVMEWLQTSRRRPELRCRWVFSGRHPEGSFVWRRFLSLIKSNSTQNESSVGPQIGPPVCPGPVAQSRGLPLPLGSHGNQCKASVQALETPVTGNCCRLPVVRNCPNSTIDQRPCSCKHLSERSAGPRSSLRICIGRRVAAYHASFPVCGQKPSPSFLFAHPLCRFSLLLA